MIISESMISKSSSKSQKKPFTRIYTIEPLVPLMLLEVEFGRINGRW
jgi:hypothetical protein